MAKTRYVKDSFWTDPYIEKCTPDEKLVFLYLLTNPQCNIAGVYEIRTKRIAYETGYDIEVIETILGRLERDNKILIVADFIVIINHIKHQSLGSKTAEGINRIIDSYPQEIIELFEKKPYFTEDSDEYEVYILKNDIPHIYPIQGAVKIPYSKVKLSKVELGKVKLGKKQFSEFENVELFEEEYNKLVTEIGDQYTKDLIEELGGYIASTGKRYKNHYATLLNWARRKGTEKNKIINYKQKTITMI